MKWRFIWRDVASKLRLNRELLKGLRHTVGQIVRRSRDVAPPFLVAPQGPVSETETREKAESIRAEYGPDYTTTLRKCRRFSELFFLEYLESEDTNDIDRLKKVKLAIQCEVVHTEFQNLLFKIYQRDFRIRHKDVLRSFQAHYSAAELLTSTFPVGHLL